MHRLRKISHRFLSVGGGVKQGRFAGLRFANYAKFHTNL
jgi:hypothetical protein